MEASRTVRHLIAILADLKLQLPSMARTKTLASPSSSGFHWKPHKLQFNFIVIPATKPASKPDVSALSVLMIYCGCLSSVL
jgi:hypothetical protein